MNFLRRFMAGRYGNDELNRFLLIVCVALFVIFAFVDNELVSMIPLLLLIYVYFRMFSRNPYARRAENQKFMVFWSPHARKIAGAKAQRADKTHVYFKCKGCQRTLRVPKGRGKIEITCPHCKAKTQKKT